MTCFRMPYRLFLLIVTTAILTACAGPAPAAPVGGTAAAAPTPTLPTPTAPAVTMTPYHTITPAPSPTSLTPTIDAGEPKTEGQKRILQVENSLVPVMDIMGAEPQSMNITDRMAYFNVPGVSIAVIDDGVIWVKSYGVVAAGSSQPVQPDTLFQAASISKTVTALGALALAQEGFFTLDEDANQLLTTWKLPSAPEKPITPRQLMSHTAGLSVHGYSGYDRGAPLPTAEQILTGSAPSHSPAVTLIHEPGSQFEYSGGGYVALQQLMMDVTGQTFPELMAQRVFGPLMMTGSAYTPLPTVWESRAAHGHAIDGTPLEGGWREYPELGPAGLWSTPGDLAEVLREIDRASRGEPTQILDQEMAREMLTEVKEGNALGLVVPGGGKLIGHGGSNAGYRALMFAVRGTGKGAVVMTNSDNGMELIFEIFRAIADVYDWPEVPGWRPGERYRAGFVEVDPAVFAGLEGSYRMGALTFAVAAEDDRLMIRIPQDGPAYRLYPDSETEFFTFDGAQFVFHLDSSGRATAVEMNGWGEAMETARRQ